MTLSMFRTLILYLLVVITLRIMGKRQIGELSPAELVITILISELAAIPAQDNAIPLLHGIVPILTLLALELIVSTCTLKSRKLRKIIVGNASVLIENGLINQKEMHRLRLNLDELLEELRICGHNNISNVQIAILESNGKLSVFPTQAPKDTGLPVTLISDGKLIPGAMERAKRNEKWIQKTLTKNGYQRIKDIFLLQVDVNGVTALIPRQKYAKEKQ